MSLLGGRVGRGRRLEGGLVGAVAALDVVIGTLVD